MGCNVQSFENTFNKIDLITPFYSQTCRACFIIDRVSCEVLHHSETIAATIYSKLRCAVLS